MRPPTSSRRKRRLGAECGVLRRAVGDFQEPELVVPVTPECIGEPLAIGRKPAARPGRTDRLSLSIIGTRHRRFRLRARGDDREARDEDDGKHPAHGSPRVEIRPPRSFLRTCENDSEVISAPELGFTMLLKIDRSCISMPMSKLSS